jgi:uncharacterized protein (TIGR02757 family)
LRCQERGFFSIKLKILSEILEDLYAKYNKREYVHPDPLEFLYQFRYLHDREIVGFLASSLAYGRVNQILKSVQAVIEPMGSSPRLFIEKTSSLRMMEIYGNFKHRFTTGHELVQVLEGIKFVLTEYGSLNEAFVKNINNNDFLLSLTNFSKLLKCQCSLPNVSMVPSPDKESACKRLCLYLRWMVREDDVDPGGWKGVDKSMLLVPLDTHMFNISKKLGLTNRNQANMKTAQEITNSFKKVKNNDPVKYDFCLTRFGIHPKISKIPLLD